MGVLRQQGLLTNDSMKCDIHNIVAKKKQQQRKVLEIFFIQSHLNIYSSCINLNYYSPNFKLLTIFLGFFYRAKEF